LAFVVCDAARLLVGPSWSGYTKAQSLDNQKDIQY